MVLISSLIFYFYLNSGAFGAQYSGTFGFQEYFNLQTKVATEHNNPTPRKIIAVADLHGDFENAMKTLQMAGIISKNQAWAAGLTPFHHLDLIPFLQV